MLWYSQRIRANSALQEEQIQPDLDSVIGEMVKNNEKWWPKRYAVNAITAPKRLAERVVSKPYRMYRVYRGQNDDTHASVYTSIQLFKKCCELLPFSYLLEHNFADTVLLICKSGFTVVIAITPPGLRDALPVESLAEFCSSYLIPSLSYGHEWICQNKSEIASYSEEILPILRTCGRQSVLFLKFSWSKSKYVITVSFNEVKPVLHRLFYDHISQEMLCDTFRNLRKQLLRTYRILYQCLPREHLMHIVENRWVFLHDVFRLLKGILTVVIVMIPPAYCIVKNAFATAVVTYEKSYKIATSFLVNNPIFKELVVEAVVRFRIICSLSISTAKDLSPVIYEAVHEFLLAVWNLLKVMLPLVQTTVITYSPYVFRFLLESAKVILPLVTLVLYKASDPELRAFITENIQKLNPVISKILQLSNDFFTSTWQVSKFMYYRMCEMESLFSIYAEELSFFYYDITIAIILGVFSAVREIYPDVYAALCVNLPIVHKGLNVVTSDLTQALVVVSPILYNGLSEVLRDCAASWTTEVYSSINSAHRIVYPDICEAVSVLTPVLFASTVEVLDGFHQAGKVITPAAINAFCVVAPEVYAAANVVAPVILSASCKVSATMLRAASELCRTFHVACMEVSSTYFNGAVVVSKDLTYAGRMILRNSRVFKGKKSYITESRYVIANALSEVDSLLWIVFCLEFTENKLPSQPRSGIELNYLICKELSSSVFRKSGKILSVALGAVLFWKGCLTKSNEYASSAICDLSIILSQCYEKVEPHMVVIHSDRILSLKNSVSSERAIYWEHSLDLLAKVSDYLPKTQFSLQNFSRDVCLFSFHLLSITSSSTWDICLATTPRVWAFVRKVSPELWNIFYSVSPVIWLSMCKSNRKMWSYIQTLAPEFWLLYRSACLSSWSLLNIWTPEVWKIVKEVSPTVWSFICEISFLSWKHLCNICPNIWQTTCMVSPLAWEQVCMIIANSWFEYRHLMVKSWNIYCAGSRNCWKAQRFMAVFVWHFLLSDDCIIEQVMRDSHVFFEKLFKCGSYAWYAFCAVTALCVIIRQCDSPKDLFVGPAFVEMNGLKNDTDVTLSINPRLSKSETKATQALLTVMDDIVSMKSFLASVTSTANNLFSFMPIEAAAAVHLKLALNFKIVSKKFGFQRVCNPVLSKSKNLLSSVLQKANYLPSVVIRQFPFA